MTVYERFRGLRESFRACFDQDRWRTDDGALTKDTARVLCELRDFCRANTSAFDADPRVHALLEGRREVWLRITAYINLTDAELLKLVDPDQPEDQSKEART